MPLKTHDIFDTIRLSSTAKVSVYRLKDPFDPVDTPVKKNYAENVPHAFAEHMLLILYMIRRLKYYSVRKMTLSYRDN